ncbi:competence type IV pilus minor pilin ComGG [Cytobacillus sp. Hz8]|uniref:competence type IV pilus minor pilin ComGG n=1 Tax=Cytobacillus sp. Hz8 TaxID=3347168 RepID=UPI0035D6EBD7
MICNEKGFTYPLTFILFLLFTIFLSIQTELYVSEKKVLKEAEQNLEKEYYFKQAVNDIQKALQENGQDMKSGTLAYMDGEVDYLIKDLTAEVSQITFQIHFPENEKVTGMAFYDKKLKIMIKWYEKN